MIYHNYNKVKDNLIKINKITMHKISIKIQLNLNLNKNKIQHPTNLNKPLTTTPFQITTSIIYLTIKLTL